MNDTKSLLTSKTIWGLAITVIGTVMGQMGFDATSLTGSEDLIVQGVGIALATYGRVKAVKKIK